LSTLFHKQSWRAAYVSLRRFPRDRRAQRHLAGFAGLFVLFAGCLAGDAAMVFARVDMATRVLILSLFAAVAVGGTFRWVYLRVEAHFDQRGVLPLVAEDVRVALAGQTVTLALLLQRAGSEECLAETEARPSVSPTTRADGLKRLAQHQLYEGLWPQARDLFLMADGHWSERQRARVLSCWEDFEALRWAMSLSRELVSIEHAPKHGWRDVLRVARDTERAVRKAKLRPAWDMRPKRDQAKRYLDRCISRMVTAGLIDAVPENADWQRKMEEIYERETQADLLVGHEYIREIDAPTLVWTAHRAARRLEMLTVLTSIASGESASDALQAYLENKVYPVSHSDSELYVSH
jgi:hypothetical protein